MATLPDEQQPIADQLFRAGLPGVRQAIQDQNATLAAEGKPTIKPSGIESLAQDLLPRVRVADWLDRADAAKAVVDELDLRDLRSVVTTAADPVVARDDATGSWRPSCARRWTGARTRSTSSGWPTSPPRSTWPRRAGPAPLVASAEGRRALPTRAGHPAGRGDDRRPDPDSASDRWAAVVEALAFSPVHSVVTPAAPPEAVSDDLRAMVKGVAGAVPQIAALLGIEAPRRGAARHAPRLPAVHRSPSRRPGLRPRRRHVVAAPRPSPPASGREGGRSRPGEGREGARG